MQNKLRFPPQTPAEKESNPQFNVVIAYEDFETGKQAKRTYDFLVDHLGKECPFGNQMWKFDVLGIPKLREMAARDAALADIIIIACKGKELGQEVKAWIELWISECKGLALVALFDCEPQDLFMVRDVRKYLETVALRGQLEFFAPEEDQHHAHRQPEHYDFERALPNDLALTALAGAVQRDSGSPRWGINE